jgi:AcrR family transcriptional regulator
VRAVAAEAGVGLGTIFAHFPDKESLLIAALIDDLDRTSEQAWATLPGEAPLQDQLLHLAREGFVAWARRPALSKVLIREKCFTPGPARDQLRALDERALARVAELLEEGRSRGELRADADPVLAARTAFSFYLITVLEEPDGTDVDTMTEQARRFLAQLFAGIAPADARRG